MHRSTKAPAVRRHHHATLGAHWNSACVLCPSLHGHGPRLARNVPPAGWSSRERVRVANVSIRATRAGHRGSPWGMGILDGPHASHCPAVVSADARMPAARARVDLAGVVRVAVCGCRRFRECPSLASVWAVLHRRRAGCGRQSAPPTLAVSDALICGCGGLPGSVREGRFGPYRTCPECGRHHVTRGRML